jgi:hypothetical protein
MLSVEKGTILNRQKRLNPRLTPQAPRREMGLAVTQTSAHHSASGDDYRIFPY